MPLLSLPSGPDGYVVEVMVGLKGSALAALQATGQAIPPPLRAQGVIDTGTNVTCVASAVLQQLGVSGVAPGTTQTVGGSHSVQLFEVSFSIVGPSGVVFTEPQLTVMEMTQPPEGVDVLVGRDVLSAGLLLGDGPGLRFTLAF
jgi:hypothetical protein